MISWNVHLFNVFTEHVPVHMQDRNIKGDHFHLEVIGAPQLLREFINLYRWYFFNFRGLNSKCHYRHSHLRHEIILVLFQVSFYCHFLLRACKIHV